MDVSTRTRRTISTVLAVLLAVESVSAVAVAAATTTASHPLPADAPAGRVLAAETAFMPASSWLVPAFSAPSFALHVVEPASVPAKAVVEVTKATTAPKATKAPKSTKSTKSTKAPKATKATKAPKATRPPTKTVVRKTHSPADYRGTNHVWIPALGINRSVRAFPCDRQRPPDNYMYRWGCAGTNNIYLMGHASSAMNGLHDAYVSGRLRKGMKAYYAGRDGTVHTYTVRWWKKTPPTTGASWAWASQDVPSMTLQTCVGANSEYRLMVRLVEIDG
jgi:hypothetical protein